jgi:hypothetical protein
MVLGLASFACPPLGIRTAVVALWLGAVVDALARRALRARDAGRRDPRGRTQTLDARRCARVGVLCFPALHVVFGLLAAGWVLVTKWKGGPPWVPRP